MNDDAASPIAIDGVVSGCALVCSGLFPWVGSGPGSSFRGVELAAALRSDAGVPDWAPTAALAIIVVALIGVLHLATSVVRRPIGRRLRLVSGALLSVGLTLTAVRFAPERWGLGLVFAAIGAVVATVMTMIEELKSSRRELLR